MFLVEEETWEPGVYQYELTDPVQGGPNGMDNVQGKQLANRTNWLKANKQDKNAILTAIAALTTAVDKMIYSTGADTFAMATLTAFARTLLDDPDAATMRATLGAVSQTDINNAITALVNSSPAALDTLKELATALGNDANFATTMTNALTGKQPIDATLTAIAALTTAADKLIYSTGPDTFSITTLTAFARTLLDDVDAATMRATIGAIALGDLANVAAYISNANGEAIKFDNGFVLMNVFVNKTGSVPSTSALVVASNALPVSLVSYTIASVTFNGGVGGHEYIIPAYAYANSSDNIVFGLGNTSGSARTYVIGRATVVGRWK